MQAGRAFVWWTEAERGRFSPWLPVFMAIGIMLFFGQRTEPSAWIAPVLLGLAAPLVVLGWRHQTGRALSLMLLAVALGFAAASFHTHALPPMPDLPRRVAIVSGTVVAVDPLPQGRRVVLRAVTLNDSRPLDRRLRIRLRANDDQPVMPGDRLRLRALLRPPYAPSFPGGWDQRRDAFFQGLAGVGFALGVAERRAAPESGIAGRWQHLRENVASRIRAVVPGTAGAIAATLLTGLNSAIPQADKAAFSTSGLSHILAVAGLHIGIVMTTVFASLRFALAHWPRIALRYPIKQIAALAAIATGGFYMAMTGMHLPIIRSFVMASLVTLGLLLGRRAISMRSLALAATVLLLLQPQSLAGVSFQMSFGAVLVLIAGYELLRERHIPLFAHRPGLVGFLIRDLSLVATTSVMACLATAPFAAYHFGQIELYSIPANMLAVPITAFWVLPWGLAAYALLPLHLEAFALVPMGWGCALILDIARTAAAMPAADLAVPPAPLWGLTLAGFGLVWLCLWQSWLRILGLLPLSLAVFLLPLVQPSPDILISPDFRLIAFREASAVYLASATKDDFTLGEWARYFGGRPILPLPAGRGANGTVLCASQGCLLPGGAAGQVLFWRSDTMPSSCHGIGFIVTTTFWDDGPGRACAAVPFVDRNTVRSGGAIAVYLGRPSVIRADRASRGDWPWLPPGGP